MTPNAPRADCPHSKIITSNAAAALHGIGACCLAWLLLGGCAAAPRQESRANTAPVENSALADEITALRRQQDQWQTALGQLQEQIAALRAQASTPAAPGIKPEELERLNAELQRLAAVAEEAQRTASTQSRALLDLQQRVAQLEAAAAAPPQPDNAKLLCHVKTITSSGTVVCLDKGSEAGIESGDMFEIYNGKLRVATVQVLISTDNLAAAAFIDKTAEVKEGYAAVKRER